MNAELAGRGDQFYEGMKEEKVKDSQASHLDNG